MSELMYENWFERLYSLVLDLLIFLAKSIFYIAESLYYTLLPDRFRKFKVSAMNYMFFLNKISSGSVNDH